MNAGIYLRTSQGDTSDEQRATIMGRVSQDEATVVSEIVHKGVSGGKASADRLAGLVQDVRDGKLQTIYVLDFSRFSREGAWGALATLGEIIGAGGRVVGVLDGFDSDMPGAAVLAAAQADAAKAYLETARSRSRAAHKRCEAEGKFPGMVTFGRRKRADGTVETHPEHGPLVTRAFEAAAAGATSTETAAILNENGEKTFSPQAATSLLSRESYWTGVLRKGDLTFPVEALTDRATYLAANAPRQRSVDKRTNGTYLLGGGIARCGGCGYTLSLKDGKFKCVNGRSRGCTAPASIEYATAERLVSEAIVKPYRSVEIDVPLAKDETPALRRALDRAEAKLEDVRSADMQDAFDTPAQWREAIAGRKSARDVAKAALAKAEAAARGRERGTTTIAADSWDDASLADRISFLRRDLDLVSVDETGRVTVWHPGTLPADLPSQGRRERQSGATPLRGIGVVDPATGVRWIFAKREKGDGIEDVPATLLKLASVTDGVYERDADGNLRAAGE